MNICLIAEATGAGVGTHVIQLASGLLSLNHRVDLAYSPLRMDEAFRSGLDVLRRQTGFTSCEFEIRRNPHPSDLGVMRRIRARFARRGPVDIVHCHSTKAGLVGRLGMFAAGARVVYTPHAMLTLNPGLSRLGRWLVGRMEQALGYIGHALIAVSVEEKDHAIDLGIPGSKVFVVPNGISLDHAPNTEVARETIRREAGLRESDLCVGFVGRLFPQKAPANLLRAFALLDPQTRESSYLLMVGAGPLLSGLRELAGSLGIEDRVRWLGERDGRTVMPAFDVFALPSDYEGLPYVVLEAMSNGLPIVSTSVGGISMLVRDHHNGHVVPVQRPDLLGAAIQSILTDPLKRRRMGVESARLIRNFSLEEMVSKTIKVYQTVLQTRTQTVPANEHALTAGTRSASEITF
jgi:glycosyltransferase involved in cell wall biosynthesis